MDNKQDREVGFVHYNKELMDKIAKGESSIKREGSPGNYKYYDNSQKPEKKSK